MVLAAHTHLEHGQNLRLWPARYRLRKDAIGGKWHACHVAHQDLGEMRLRWENVTRMVSKRRFCRVSNALQFGIKGQCKRIARLRPPAYWIPGAKLRNAATCLLSACVIQISKAAKYPPARCLQCRTRHTLQSKRITKARNSSPIRNAATCLLRVQFRLAKLQNTAAHLLSA